MHMADHPNGITKALAAAASGEPRAAEQLLPLVYDELRRVATQQLAHERPGQTLQATALVHEAYLAAEDATKAELVKLRFFAGLSEQEAAELLGISRATAARHWAYARAWLFERLRDEGSKN